MRKKSMKKRLISLLTLALLLVPMFVLTTYAASSPKTNFNFVFNGTGGVKRQAGTKTDLGESTAGAAGVTVTTAELGAGRCTISIEDRMQVTITGTARVSGKGSYPLYYKQGLGDSGSMNVFFACYAEKTVQALAGYFQP